MSKYLFELEERNRLAQNGLLKRFGPKCIGHQETLENIRANKTAKFLELKKDRSSKEFEKYFLKYVPLENKNKRLSKKSKEDEGKTKKKTKKQKTEKKRKDGESNGLKGFLMGAFK